jgi:hypothetical protein
VDSMNSSSDYFAYICIPVSGKKKPSFLGKGCQLRIDLIFDDRPEGLGFYHFYMQSPLFWCSVNEITWMCLHVKHQMKSSWSAVSSFIKYWRNLKKDSEAQNPERHNVVLNHSSYCTYCMYKTPPQIPASSFVDPWMSLESWHKSYSKRCHLYWRCEVYLTGS